MRRLPVVPIAILAFVLLVSLGPWGCYYYGLRWLPEDARPADPASVPDAAIRLLWSDLRGRGEPARSELNPFSYFRSFGAPGMLVSYQAARKLLEDSGAADLTGMRRVVAGTSATIWVSRQWSARESLATTLTRYAYGNGFEGLGAAARGYFGAPPAALGTTDLARLVVLIRSPSHFDPWCRPEESAEAVRLLLDRAALEVVGDASPLLPAPAGACDEEP